MFRCNIPEGVEVKISSELIGPIVQGRKIESVLVTPNSRYAGKLPEGMVAFLTTTKDNANPVLVDSVKTKGKLMYWTFSNGWYMLCTFGMSGQWSESAGNHPCLMVSHTNSKDSSDEKDIFFNDPRHFGTIKFSNNQKDLKNKLNELGWDPLQEDISMWLKFLTRTIQNSDKPIGQLLMDQSIFAGVGNYIRAEALYLAKISPWRKGNKLSATEISNLCNSLVEVMKDSYSYQGATIHTYKDSYGNEGRYSSCFKVYGQKTDPLGNNIIKETTPEGRSIHWCPTIQV